MDSDSGNAVITRVANPVPGIGIHECTQLFTTNSTKKKDQGVDRIKGWGSVALASRILSEINSGTWEADVLTSTSTRIY